MILNEQNLRNIIRESISEIMSGIRLNEGCCGKGCHNKNKKRLNEIGDTDAGQRTLGKVAGRAAAQGRFDMANRASDEAQFEINNVDSKERENPDYQETLPNRIKKQQMRGSFKQGYDEERQKHYMSEDYEGTIDGEAIDFDDFEQILDDNGWSYCNYYRVNNGHGKTGYRYEITNDKNEVDINTLINILKQNSNNPDGIILSNGTHRYAPEIQRYSITILDC